MLQLLESALNGLLDLTSKFVIPDWGALIALLPVFIVIGVIGPIVTLLVLGWLVYFVRAPRTRLSVARGPIRLGGPADVAALSAPSGGSLPVPASGFPTLAPGTGDAEVPVGLPYCQRDRLVFASRDTRCTLCREALTVVCPMCGLGRDAGIRTCGNCGLVLKVEDRPRILRSDGPPPGGAALA